MYTKRTRGKVGDGDKRIEIGKVDVDSGQIVICDPCRIRHDGNEKALNEYGHTMQLTDNLHLQLNFDNGHDGLGVVFSSGFGDGQYPVYATIGSVALRRKGRVVAMRRLVKRVEIDLLPPGWLEAVNAAWLRSAKAHPKPRRNDG